MKKIFFMISLLCPLFALSALGVSAQLWENGNNFPYGDTPVKGDISLSNTENIPKVISEGMITSENSLLNKFLQAFGFGGPTYEGIPKALIYVKNIVNLLLGLVSFVALVIILYSFYLMFFTEDSKGIEQVKKNLKGVAIALVILGFSRIIVSFIFDFYQKRLLNPQTEITFVSSSSLTSIT